MNHWTNAHDLEKIKSRIKEKEVYLLYKKEEPIGTITLCLCSSYYYKDEDKTFWKEPNAQAFYLSGLAVLSKY
ncbi:MAG: hypothetical protein AABX38_06830 [Candidatus Micrarchaeota archaeon]